jgi:hypothetical protein
MSVSVDVWLRGDQHATTVPLDGVPPQPQTWTDADVRGLLEGMLRAMDRLQRPGKDERDIALRGLSWIVNPYEGGGVVVAIEITLGAAVAGPFDIEQATLSAMITRVLAPSSRSTTVH